MQTISMKQERRMEIEAVKDLIPLLVAGATTLGGAVAWLYTRMDAKNIKEREFQQAERAKLEKFFSEQINDLQSEVHNQNQEINQLRRELNTYVRHVGILEGLLKSKGVEPPPLILTS